jgi:hypothetical protein
MNGGGLALAQSRHEAFGHRVIAGIGHRFHRRKQSYLFSDAILISSQMLSAFDGCVLAAAIRMVDQPRSEIAIADCHVRGIEDKPVFRRLALDHLATFLEKVSSPPSRRG